MRKRLLRVQEKCFQKFGKSDVIIPYKNFLKANWKFTRKKVEAAAVGLSVC